MNRQSVLAPLHKEKLANKRGHTVTLHVMTHVNKGKVYPYHSKTKAQRASLMDELARL